MPDDLAQCRFVFAAGGVAIGASEPPIHAPTAIAGARVAKQLFERRPQIGRDWPEFKFRRSACHFAANGGGPETERPQTWVVPKSGAGRLVASACGKGGLVLQREPLATSLSVLGDRRDSLARLGREVAWQ